MCVSSSHACARGGGGGGGGGGCPVSSHPPPGSAPVPGIQWVASCACIVVPCVGMTVPAYIGVCPPVDAVSAIFQHPLIADSFCSLCRLCEIQTQGIQRDLLSSTLPVLRPVMLLLRPCQASTCATGPSQCHTPSRKTQREKDMDQQQVNGGGRKGGREGGKERREGGMEGGEGMEGRGERTQGGS